MNELHMLPTLARSVWHDFLRARRELFVYEILFKLAEAWLLAPSIALFLAAILSQAGHVAVSNQDIVDFLLTPLGMLYAALFITFAAALLLFEQAGAMALVSLRTSSARPAIGPMLRHACAKSGSIVKLGAMQAGLLVLALALSAQPERYYFILENGRIVDGTGAPWFRGDVAIRGDRIAAIGDLHGAVAKERLDVRDHVIAPGFIDMLGQSPFTVLIDPRAESKKIGRAHV